MIRKKDLIQVLKNREVEIFLIVLLLLTILVGSTWIRTQNLPLLKEVNTGEAFPSDLDSFYFLRIAETIVQQGSLPEYDSMRYPSLKVPYLAETLPQVLVLMYKTARVFDKEITLRQIDVIYPVVFFIIGLLLFFFLVLVLTDSKWLALLSTGFLAFIPVYLQRTIAGASDHDALGIAFFFLTILVYTLSMKQLEKEEKTNLNTSLFAIATGLATALTLGAWSGVANFIFILIPATFCLFWILKTKDAEKRIYKKEILFYGLWILFTLLFSLLIGFSIKDMLSFISRINNMGIFAVLGLILIDSLLILYSEKIFKKDFKEKRILASLGATIFVGILLLLTIFGGAIFSEMIARAAHPFEKARVGLTVQENVMPYLKDWFNNFGTPFFWIFYIGVLLLGVKISECVEKKKDKIILFFLWGLMVSGILFTRISEQNLFNGQNFISNITFALSILFFLVYFIRTYFNEKIEIKIKNIILIIFVLLMLLIGREAIRFFFLMVPVICLVAAYSFFETAHIIKTRKDGEDRVFLFLLLVLIVIGLGISGYNYAQTSSAQAKVIGPTAGVQWQSAMQWAKNNTPQGSIFVSWWDYGYWIQTLGQRPTLTDGGHAATNWDYLVGRYVLTTPNPETALSFVKTQNVSYLLIDSTDIGKYPAFSKIGSDKTGEDRYAIIPLLLVNAKQTKNTANETTKVYENGLFPVDEDITYSLGGKDVFVPKNKAYVMAVVSKTIRNANESVMDQPRVVFLYNNQQILIPVRYLYLNGNLLDYKGGLNSTVYLFPKISSIDKNSADADRTGAALYLSEKTTSSLFGQLYLLNNSSGEYGKFELVHSEQDPSIDYLKLRGFNPGEVAYIQGTLRGPIKIWKINHDENILVNKEFLGISETYDNLDNLTFIK